MFRKWAAAPKSPSTVPLSHPLRTSIWAPRARVCSTGSSWINHHVARSPKHNLSRPQGREMDHCRQTAILQTIRLRSLLLVFKPRLQATADTRQVLDQQVGPIGPRRITPGCYREHRVCVSAIQVMFLSIQPSLALPQPSPSVGMAFQKATQAVY